MTYHGVSVRRAVSALDLAKNILTKLENINHATFIATGSEDTAADWGVTGLLIILVI